MNSKSPHAFFRFRRNRDLDITAKRGVLTALVAVVTAATGCQSSLDMTELSDDQRYAELSDTSDVRGPLERILPVSWTRSADEAAVDQQLITEARSELEAAQQLFDEEKHGEAESAAAKVGRRYKDTALREDALYLEGEAQFAQKKFAKAQDTYGQLLVDFPSTRYMDRVSRRMFTIAQSWLGFPDVATSSEILQVSHESADGEPAPAEEPGLLKDPTLAVPVLPNFHDRSRPIFDTKGRALNALKSIWMNDPTGPLADDSLMLTASHYLRKGDYVEADRYFQILREEYPKSPHLEGAFVLGSHVKLMSYQGAVYDGTRLEEARELKESALRLFPDSNDRTRLREELKQIEEAAAARDWALVEFYQRKGKPRAIAVYCNELIENHPQSSYAQRARELLAQLGESDALKPEPKPEQRTPFRFPNLLPVPNDAEPVEPAAPAQPGLPEYEQDVPETPREAPGSVNLTGGARG